MTRDSGHWIAVGAPPGVARLLVAARQREPSVGAVERALVAVRGAAVPTAATGAGLLSNAWGARGPGWLKWCIGGGAGPLLVLGALIARSALTQSSEPAQVPTLGRSVVVGQSLIESRARSIAESVIGAAGEGGRSEHGSSVLGEGSGESRALASTRSRGARSLGRGAARKRGAVGVARADAAGAVSHRELSDVERQIRLLRGVRQAVEEGEPRRALTLLSDYERSFTQKHFAPEALLLRRRALRLMETLHQAARGGRNPSRSFAQFAKADEISAPDSTRPTP